MPKCSHSPNISSHDQKLWTAAGQTHNQGETRETHQEVTETLPQVIRFWSCCCKAVETSKEKTHITKKQIVHVSLEPAPRLQKDCQGEGKAEWRLWRVKWWMGSSSSRRKTDEGGADKHMQRKFSKEKKTSPGHIKFRRPKVKDNTLKAIRWGELTHGCPLASTLMYTSQHTHAHTQMKLGKTAFHARRR